MKKTINAAALLQPDKMATAYLLGMLIWYPLFIKDYLQVSQTKLTAFLTFTLLCAVAVAFSPQETKPIRRFLDVRSGFIAAFAVAALLSTVLSLDSKSSLWSYEGYLGGLIMCAACLIAYFLLCAYLSAEAVRVATLLFMPAGAVVCLLALLNDFGVDPFGMYRAIDKTQTNIFFSTIGNVDYLDSFFCLWLPVVCGQWMRGKSRAARTVAFGCALPGLAAAAALDPGILALGIAFAVLVCLCFVPLDKTDWQRLCILAAVYFAVQGFLYGMDAVFPLRMRERPFAALGMPAVMAVGVCLSLGAAVLLRRGGAAPRALLWQRVAVVPVCGVVVALFVVANVFGANLGALNNFFYINGDWATGRGAIWADSMALFRQTDVLRKLVGYGPGMLHRALLTAQNLPYALADTYGAHCEYLDELVCGGILGLAVLLGLLFVHLLPALRAAAKNQCDIGWLVGACAYAGQAAFNNRVPMVFPIFIVVLAVLRVTDSDSVPEQDGGSVPMQVAGSLVLFAVAALLAQLLFQKMF